VRVDGQSYNSIEVKGPVMPDAVYNFCDLLSKSLKTFTATFANLENTKPFTLASETNKGTIYRHNWLINIMFVDEKLEITII